MLNTDVKYADRACGYAVVMDTMGARIKQLRQSKGWTQSDLARMVGVTKSAVSQWELGSTASIKLPEFLDLCRKLGTDPYYIVFGNDRQPADQRTRAR